MTSITSSAQGGASSESQETYYLAPLAAESVGRFVSRPRCICAETEMSQLPIMPGSSIVN